MPATSLLPLLHLFPQTLPSHLWPQRSQPLHLCTRSSPLHLPKNTAPAIHFQLFSLYWISAIKWKHAAISPILKKKQQKNLLVTLLLLSATHPHPFFMLPFAAELFSASFSISTSGYIPKTIESRVSKRYLHAHVHSSIIHSSQKVEATQMSIDEWMDKQNVVYTSNGILFSLKKERSFDSCYNMAEPWGDYAKWKKQILYDSKDKYCMRYLKWWILRESGMVVARGWGKGRMGSCCLTGVEF